MEEPVIGGVVIVGVAPEPFLDRDHPPQRQMRVPLDRSCHPIEPAQVGKAIEVGLDESSQQQTRFRQAIGSDQAWQALSPDSDGGVHLPTPS